MSLLPFHQPNVPAFVNKYPSLKHAVPLVQHMLRRLPHVSEKPPPQEGQFELEARLGTIQRDGRQSFIPGVSREFMDKCLETVSNFDEWKQVTDWSESHDYYYQLAPHPEDLQGQGIFVRTTVSFPVSASPESSLTTSHIYKQVRHKQDFQYLPTAAHHLGTLMPGLDLRVSLNFEEKVPADSIPSRIQPKLVRIKDRKSYIYQPAYSAVPLWSIDFTKSWSGASRSEAEMKQRGQQTVYEIEVECLDPYAAMTDPKRDQYNLATSLLLKVQDLIPDQDFRWEPVFKYGSL